MFFCILKIIVFSFFFFSCVFVLVEFRNVVGKLITFFFFSLFCVLQAGYSGAEFEMLYHEKRFRSV